jgi:hypothetical protein
MYHFEWMRLTPRKFHFLKVESIVMDPTVLHKSTFSPNPA